MNFQEKRVILGILKQESGGVLVYVDAEAVKALLFTASEYNLL